VTRLDSFLFVFRVTGKQEAMGPFVFQLTDPSLDKFFAINVPRFDQQICAKCTRAHLLQRFTILAGSHPVAFVTAGYVLVRSTDSHFAVGPTIAFQTSLTGGYRLY
jgi:hypothetical protein